MLQMLTVVFIKKNKDKKALKTLYLSQGIVSELDENVHRHFDYIVSVNCLTAYLLIKVEQPKEAQEFIQIAEKAVQYLLKTKIVTSKEDSGVSNVR